MKCAPDPDPLEPAHRVAWRWLQDQAVFLGMHATGIDATAEVVALAVLDHRGHPIFDTLIKPTRPIPVVATWRHDITDADVETAPGFAEAAWRLQEAIRGRRVIAYIAGLQVRCLHQSAVAAGIVLQHGIEVACAMRLFMRWRNPSSAYHYWARDIPALDDAVKQCGIQVMAGPRRATRDAALCWRLIAEIAKT